MRALPDYKTTFPQWSAVDLSKAVPGLDEDGIDLLAQTLIYDPAHRISGESARSYADMQPSARSSIPTLPATSSLHSPSLPVSYTLHRPPTEMYCTRSSLARHGAVARQAENEEHDDVQGDQRCGESWSVLYRWKRTYCQPG